MRKLTLKCRIIDDDGNDISSYDQPGELCIRGPTVIKEYFGNPKATAESFDSEGYFKTGDIMYCSSKERKWYIIDRKKELIKVRGFQVAPAEMYVALWNHMPIGFDVWLIISNSEGVLLSHPSILDAGVIGILDPKDSTLENPRAYVVRRPGIKEVSEAEIVAYCRERLSRYKDLTGGVRFIDVLPRNATGKILKRILRDIAVAETKTQGANL